MKRPRAMRGSPPVRSVFRQSLRSYRTSLSVVSAALFGISVVLVATFDAFGGVEGFEQLLELLPESIRAMLKAQGGFASDATGYLGMQYRHPFYLLSTSGFAIAMASGAVAREIERNTALMLLAVPLARWRYLGAKIASIAVVVVVLLVAVWAGTGAGVAVTGLEGVEMLTLGRALVNLLALALAIGGIATLLSALSSDGGHVVSVAAGVAAAMFFGDFVAAIWSPAELVGYVSLYHYYDPLGVTQSGLPMRDLAVLLGVAAAGFGGALVAFQRRDLAP